MTLQQLQYIVALDTYRHFVRAAESCFVAQPTLTLQVKKLEQEVGLVIFDRSAKPLVPTRQGENFILKARQILREVEGLKEMVNTDRQLLKGTYKLGIIPTLAPYLLPLFLKKFSDAHQEVNLEIMELQSDDILEQLENGKIDIGLMVTPTYLNYVREIKLFKEPFIVYAQQEHDLLKKEVLNAEDIQDDGLWLLDQGHCFRDQVLNICNTNYQNPDARRIIFQTGSLETLKKMIQGHSGYTLIPELAVEEQDLPYIRKFESPQPVRQIGMVVHNSFTRELLIKNLRDVILDSIPDQFTKSTEFITVKWR